MRSSDGRPFVLSNKQCNAEQMEQAQKEQKKMTIVKLENQPVSSYPWIVYQKGFNTLHEVAEYYNINYDKLKNAVETTPRRRTKMIAGIVKKFLRYDTMYKGNLLSIKEIQEMSGISKGTIEKRLSRKWTVEKIINTPVRGKHETEIFPIDGKVYYGLGAVSRAYSISLTTLRDRVYHQKMSIEEAVYKPVRPGNEKNSCFWCLGKKWKNFSALCAEYQLSEATVRDNQKKNPNKTLDDIILKMLNKRPYCYVVYGKDYPTVKAIAVAYQVEYRKLYSRMRTKAKYGSIEEIIEALKNDDALNRN